MASTTINFNSAVQSSDNGGTVAWTNPANAASQDWIQASAVVTLVGDTTYELRWSGLTLSAIPPNAVIDGLAVQVFGNSSFYMTGNIIPRLISGAKIGEKASMGSGLPMTSSAWSTAIGGATDLWGQSWTRDELTNLVFAAKLASGLFMTGSQTFSIDAARITIYWHPGVDDSKLPAIIPVHQPLTMPAK